jgi:hypothetical protein
MQPRRKDVLLGLVSTRPNQAERDLRMVRMKSKVIGTFRSEQGAKDFLMLKSFTSTAAKAGVTAFDALLSLFVGQMGWGVNSYGIITYKEFRYWCLIFLLFLNQKCVFCGGCYVR